MCTSVVNGDVLACSPFCACDSPVCMPWCGEMQCAKDDVGDPDREMLKNPSCTGCAEVRPRVHCESAGDFSTKAPATSKGPNGGKLIGEEEADEEEEKEECSLEHQYAEHEMLSAAVARLDQENRRYAAALPGHSLLDATQLAPLYLLRHVKSQRQHVHADMNDLLAQQQVVIKSLESNYRPVAGVSGATILGDGRVALILDIPGLLRMARRQGDFDTAGTLRVSGPRAA